VLEDLLWAHPRDRLALATESHGDNAKGWCRSNHAPHHPRRNLKEPVRGISRSRVLAAGALWVLVYNLIWGVAWFAFMRREWLEAMAVKRPLATPEFWVVGAVLTLPIGVATMAYVGGRVRAAPVPKAALAAGLAVWTLMTMWMAGLGWQESLSIRIIAIDSTVNLVSLVAASLAGEWSQRVRLHGRKPAHTRHSTILPLLGICVCAAASLLGQQPPAATDTTLAPSRCGQLPSPISPDTIDRTVLAWMRRSRTPAASIAIARRGHSVMERAYGWADLVNCVPATPDMRFGIGSISKQITALGVLVLVQQGKLALDDTISTWFAEAGDVWRGITVRHLLTHTSGIRDTGHDDEVYPQNEIDKRHEVTDSGLVASLAAPPLNFPPGEGWAYSNTGYLLLSLLIQRAGGAPYPVWMREHVFGPLGMHATRYYDAAEIVPALARGYTTRDGRLRQGYFSSSSYSHWGDMGIVSTAHDMALWSAELESPRLVGAALHAEMLAPTRLRDGSAFPYGFGLLLDDYRGERVLSHSGTYDAGYSASLNVLPERGLSVVVLTNQHQGDPWDFAGALMELVDSTLRPASALHPERDPAPDRTRRLTALLNGDSTAAPTTPAFHRLMYPRIRGFLAELLPLAVEYVTCDDVARRQLEQFGATAERECYYRLRHGSMVRFLSVLYARDGRIMGMYPRS
jgi:CubicO group peptidase (beta-lactamase class C family)